MSRNQEVIAVLGLIIALCACVAGWLAIPQVQRFVEQFAGTQLPTPTIVAARQTAIPSSSTSIQPSSTVAVPTSTAVLPTTAVPTSAPLTATPQPMITPMLSATPSPRPTPTNTLIPSPTIVPDTSAGRTLEVRDTWRQSGLELTLAKVNLYPKDKAIGTKWQFGNTRSQDIVLSLSPDNFVVTDNLGRRYDSPTRYDSSWNDYLAVNTICDTKRSVLLKNAGNYNIECGINDMMLSYIDISNPSINEVTITVSIASISNARWRIPIYH